MTDGYRARLDNAHERFVRATRQLDESDSAFAPTDEMSTAAQQIAYVAHTIEWFIEGAYRADGFDMDFEQHGAAVRQVSSRTAARTWLDRAVESAREAIADHDDAEWAALLPDGPVFGTLPRHAIFDGIADHPAHHRGVLTVYTRLRGKVAPLPYMEMDVGT